MTTEVEVIDQVQRAKALLDEGRIRILEALSEPASAAALARRLDQPRQRINYHLRELEAHRLIELVEERRRGNATERIYRRSSASYVISTSALGNLGSEPEAMRDRFSSAYQIALAARAIRELDALRIGAAKAKQRLPTFALDLDVRFASADERNQFAEELAGAVADLARKYHRDEAPRGRTFRFWLGGYPRPKNASG